MKYLLLALFMMGCTDLGTLDYNDHDTIRVTGYFETWEQRNSPNPEFIVSSSDKPLPDTISITGTINALPQPRVLTGLVLFDQQPPYNLKMIVYDQIELEHVKLPIEEYKLLALEDAYYAHTDKGRFVYSIMLRDRQQAPEISVGQTFKATKTDSTFTALDR